MKRFLLMLWLPILPSLLFAQEPPKAPEYPLSSHTTIRFYPQGGFDIVKSIPGQEDQFVILTSSEEKRLLVLLQRKHPPGLPEG